MRTRLLLKAAIVLCAAAVVPSAAGDGGPGLGGVQGWDGMKVGAIRYVAIPAIGSTTIAVIRRKGGRVLKFVSLRGRWGIPMVAMDGTTAGLMRDGHTLLLEEPTSGPYLRPWSSFAAVDMKKLRVLEPVRIRGHFSFDALSPDGRYLYLVEFVSQQDFQRYRVRAYDMRTRKLLPKPVVDRREGETTMQGSPISRTTSPNGRWAYTLYGGAGHAFIHALDTTGVGAICIDLWHKEPRQLFEFRLRFDNAGRLVVRGPRGRILAAIDRRSHKIVSSVRHP